MASSPTLRNGVMEEKSTGTSVTVEIDAQSSLVAVLRAAASTLATRLEFTLDEIDDLRIAVDEAASLLLQQTQKGDTLRCDLDLHDKVIHCRLSAPSHDVDLALEGFGWVVLNVVADDITVSQVDGRSEIRLTTKRAVMQD
jgi:serine/threonine-protein kinase RsbW